MTKILRWIVLAWRYGLSPYLGSNCRFHPSCSSYALEALATHGAARGAWLATRRLLRCHPLNPGGYDPVPVPADRTAACSVEREHEGAGSIGS